MKENKSRKNLEIFQNRTGAHRKKSGQLAKFTKNEKILSTAKFLQKHRKKILRVGFWICREILNGNIDIFM